MGCIVFELCALKVPFDAPNIPGLVQKIVKAPIPSVPGSYSSFLKELVGQMSYQWKDGESVVHTTESKYDDSNQVVHVKSGVNYDEFLEELKDDERLYGFIRIESGDEMSKRAKFVLVAWVGENVSPMKKAKVGTDKSFVKAVLKNFAVEILTGERSELQLDQVKQLVQKAGGANYGTGQ